MKNLWFIRRGMSLVPASEDTADRMKRVKEGRMCQVELVQPRNIKFHGKFFSLLNFAFQYWEPEHEELNGMTAEKDFERFRKDAIILAGYRHAVVNLKGEVRYEADSIAFGNMDEEEFGKLYKSVFNVLWRLVMSNVPGMTEQEAENAINQMLDYE